MIRLLHWIFALFCLLYFQDGRCTSKEDFLYQEELPPLALRRKLVDESASTPVTLPELSNQHQFGHFGLHSGKRHSLKHHNNHHNHQHSIHDDHHIKTTSISPAALDRLKQTQEILHNSTLTSTGTVPLLDDTDDKKLHIIFVYTVVPAVCKYGLPEYIQITLRHTVYTQPDCIIVMASNYMECEKTREQVSGIHGVLLIDTVEIMSNRTHTFANLSSNVFASDYSNELWMTSALRFLNIEDIMITLNLTYALHVEADNLLYGRVSTLLPLLRGHYPLAATPLNTAKTFITASVLWIASFPILKHFTDFFLDITTNDNNRWKNYLYWVRPYACCKPGGIDPDANGLGLKPYAINEMSMISYYHELYPERMMLLPVIPYFTGYQPRRNFAGNLNEFRPGELETHHLIPGHGIWDPNSWGQYLGGTSKKRGRDRGFVDTSHIAGQAIKAMACKPAMLCAAYATNNTESVSAVVIEQEKHRVEDGSGSIQLQGKWMNEMNVTMPDSSHYRYYCVTAPYVRCGESGEWTPLWNLHVHSKNTMEFQSKPCNCSIASVVEYFPQL